MSHDVPRRGDEKCHEELLTFEEEARVEHAVRLMLVNAQKFTDYLVKVISTFDLFSIGIGPSRYVY